MMTQKSVVPVLPDFTRWQWASVAERAWWQPLFTEATNAFVELERLAVVRGIRRGAYQYVALNDVQRMSTWAAEHGLVMVPITAASTGSGYSSSGSTGPQNAIRVVYVKPEHCSDVFPFDNQNTGKILGYPSCCRTAFDATWGQHHVDSTYEQLTPGHFSVEASTMLRFMGIRFVPHMPCHFACEESIKSGLAFEQLGKDSGFIEQMRLIREVQNWPMTWNRLFGIAVTETPALKITTRSDWTPTKDEFIVNPTGVYHKPTKDLWEANGFKNPDAMRQAHTTLLNMLATHLPQNARVLDLGCGNGLLLKRLVLHRPDVKIAGIDANLDRLPKGLGTGKWYHGSIESGCWVDWIPSAVLINPKRVLEMTPESASKIQHILADIPQVFLYTYDDGDLGKHSHDAGLPVRVIVKTKFVCGGLNTPQETLPNPQ